ncbi:MAG: UvrD-helicase domain-containing protein [Kiritimatiellae bacterium]|nr:UvrD-helicase domain-containing protein [Kiritimatiellia bacterium]
MNIASEYLSASAGSGKTFALSKRYCQLVMARERPEEICALTFTRAATREIFSAIVARLTEPENMLEPVANGLSREEALAKILEALPRLQISTIDAFASKIARLFAYELGLNPDFALYDGGNSPEAKRMLRESVRRALTQTDGKNVTELLDLFDVQHGEAAASDALSVRLRTFFEQFGAELEAHPEGWGDLKPLEIPLRERCETREEVARQALDYLSEVNQQQVRRKDEKAVSEAVLKKLRQILQTYYPEQHSLRWLKKAWGGSWEEAKYLKRCATSETFTYNRTEVILGEALQQCFARLWDDLLVRDFQQTAEHTKRLHRALMALKAAYDQLTEETGNLSFEALTKTLARTVGRKVSVRNPDAFYIAYRLDAAIRHLMIDEFQDTSTEQWSILSGMAHELAASDDGTFFYVGDVKQSIYGWRGGDATLFGDETRLPALPAGAPLVMSYRSCRVVIALINRLMAFKDVYDKKGAPPPEWQAAAVEKWQQTWVEHVASPKRMAQDGYVKMLAFAGKKPDWRKEMAHQIAERWRELSGKRLTFAVLAATNSTFQEEDGLLHHLRREGVPCAIEGKQAIADTPLGTLVIQLLHWMADPRATLWPVLAEKIGLAPKIESKQRLAEWMICVNRSGFTAWLEMLFGHQSAFQAQLSEADRNVLATIRKGLEAQDALGVVDPAVVRDALTVLQVPCAADKGVVNLMTIHQAKGLTFSVVFTILAGRIIADNNVTHEVGEDWVMERPVLSEAYDESLPLKYAKEKRKMLRMRDTLCALYVAITRAEREQIILAPLADAGSLSTRAGWIYHPFADQLPKSSKSKEAEGDAVVCCFEDGVSTWWQNEAAREIAAPVPKTMPTWVKVEREESVEVALPSEHGKAKTLAEVLAKRAISARDFGVAQHQDLAQIDWTDTPPSGIPAEVFAKPRGEVCELWRERPFSVRLSSEGGLRYIAGQFDRVHIFPQSRTAVIYDFKSAHMAQVTSAYATQLKEYRAALATLLGYKESDICMKLVFTRHNKVLEVPADAGC